MLIMHTFLLFATLLVAQASEACNRDTGAGCAIETPSDEVSLIQTKHKVEERGDGGSDCDWDGTDPVPTKKFVCATCPKVSTVAHAAGLVLQVKKDNHALFTQSGQCHERAVMDDPKGGSAGKQYECTRSPDFAGPCTKANEDSCVCHLGTKGEGMTFKEMVAGFKKTLKEAISKDEEAPGGDFSRSEEEGETCNWDGHGDTPTDKFICSKCPKVQKVVAAKGKEKGSGTVYDLQYTKAAKTLFSAGTDCFERVAMVDTNNPDGVPENFQCRRDIMFSGPCTAENEDKCSCGLGLDGDGATFKDLAEAIDREHILG
jgi:hypothetical protein